MPNIAGLPVYDRGHANSENAWFDRQGNLCQPDGTPVSLADRRLPLTSYHVERLASYPTATEQYDSTGNVLGTLSMSGAHGRAVPTVIAGGGPFGGDCVRIYPEVTANGRANVLVGSTAALGVGSLYDPVLGQYGKALDQGLTGFWIRVNLDATDQLDAASASIVQPDLFVWPSSKEATMTPNSAALRQERLSPGQWSFLTLKPTDWSGGAITNALNGGVQIGVICAAGNAGRTTTVDLAPVYGNIRQVKPSFTLSLDNDDISHYTNAYPYAKARGVALQFYSDPLIWGATNVCTYAQMAEMAAAGCSIGFHGNAGSAADLANGFYKLPTNPTLLAQCVTEIGILKGLGYDWQHMAWPLGMFDPTAEALFRSLGVVSARSIGAATGYATPPQNAFYKSGYGPWATLSTDPWITIRANIDATVAAGGHLDIWGHVITGGNVGTFRQVVDYLTLLRDRGACEILTAPQYYAKYLAQPWM